MAVRPASTLAYASCHVVLHHYHGFSPEAPARWTTTAEDTTSWTSTEPHQRLCYYPSCHHQTPWILLNLDCDLFIMSEEASAQPLGLLEHPSSGTAAASS